MNSEKVKEIKKAIQETIDGKLSTEYLTVCEISCCPRLDIDKLFADILTYINELESENDTLHTNLCEWRKENQKLKDRIALLEKDNELLRNAKVVYENVDYCYEDLKKAEKRIAELEKVYDRQVRIINDLNIEVVKMQEKLPKFAERLKEKLFDLGNIVNDNDIDETLKECINGKERK